MIRAQVAALSAIPSRLFAFNPLVLSASNGITNGIAQLSHCHLPTYVCNSTFELTQPLNFNDLVVKLCIDIYRQLPWNRHNNS